MKTNAKRPRAAKTQTMSFVGQLAGQVLVTVRDLYKGLNPATLTGCIDVIVVRRADGSLVCSPFHVRFGKLGVLSSREKVVDIEVNGFPVDLQMKLGDNGEAFFVLETDEGELPPHLSTSPIPMGGAGPLAPHATTPPSSSTDPAPKGELSDAAGSAVATEMLKRQRMRRRQDEVEGRRGGGGGESTDEEERDEEEERGGGRGGDAGDIFDFELDEEAPASARTVTTRRGCVPSPGEHRVRAPTFMPTQKTLSDGEWSPTPSPSRSPSRSPQSDSELSVVPSGGGRQHSAVEQHMQWAWGGFPRAALQNRLTMTGEHRDGDTSRLPARGGARLDSTTVESSSSSSSSSAAAIANGTMSAAPKSLESAARVRTSSSSAAVETSPSGSSSPTAAAATAPATQADGTAAAASSSSGVSSAVPGESPCAVPAILIEGADAAAKSPAPRGPGEAPTPRDAAGATPRAPLVSWDSVYEDAQSGLVDVAATVTAAGEEEHQRGEGGEHQGVSGVALPATGAYGGSYTTRPASLPLSGPPCRPPYVASPPDSGTDCRWDSPPSPFTAETPWVALSLCGGLSDGAAQLTEERFREFAVSFGDLSENPELLNDPQLVVKIGGSYYNWAVAAPIVIAVHAFGRPLPQACVERLVSQKMSRSTYRSWFSWGRRDNSALDSPGRGEPLSAPSGAESIPSTNTDSTTQSAPHEESPVGLQDPPQMQKLRPPPTSPPGGRPPAHSFRKTLLLSSQQLARLGLRPGANDVSFSVTTPFQGTTQCQGTLYLWEWDSHIVISDIDGTITKSDALGQILPQLGKDWTHEGIARLFHSIHQNGYKFLYCSARAIGMAHMTRGYLQGVSEQGAVLPRGPLLLSPSSLFAALHREVIEKKPERFKIECLRDISRLFHPNRAPFYAAFGNKSNDVLAYREVGVAEPRIFTVNPRGELVQEAARADKSSYGKLHDAVDHMFPRLGSKGGSERVGAGGAEGAPPPRKSNSLPSVTATPQPPTSS